MDLDRVLRLTPRQINDIYGHPRTKEGVLEQPAPSDVDSGARLLQLLAMVHAGFIKATPEQTAELERRVNGR